MSYRIQQASRQGARTNNEDRMGHRCTDDTVLLVLADGMGGHPRGEMAAQYAVETMLTAFDREARPGIDNPPRFLLEALLRAHKAIGAYAQAERLDEHPRTTLLAVLVQDDQAWAIHAGDTRLYWLREGAIWKRTRDHSLHEQAIEAGVTEPSVGRHVLFGSLGAKEPPVYDRFGPHALQPGDRLLLCTDGIWNAVADDEIVRHGSETPLDAAIESLADRAIVRAGARSDNASVMALDWRGPARRPPQDLQNPRA